MNVIGCFHSQKCISNLILILGKCPDDFFAENAQNVDFFAENALNIEFLQTIMKKLSLIRYKNMRNKNYYASLVR